MLAELLILIISLLGGLILKIRLLMMNHYPLMLEAGGADNDGEVPRQVLRTDTGFQAEVDPKADAEGITSDFFSVNFEWTGSTFIWGGRVRWIELDILKQITYTMLADVQGINDLKPRDLIFEESQTKQRAMNLKIPFVYANYLKLVAVFLREHEGPITTIDEYGHRKTNNYYKKHGISIELDTNEFVRGRHHIVKIENKFGDIQVSVHSTGPYIKPDEPPATLPNETREESPRFGV